jgi:hypothetical protein
MARPSSNDTITERSEQELTQRRRGAKAARNQIRNESTRDWMSLDCDPRISELCGLAPLREKLHGRTQPRMKRRWNTEEGGMGGRSREEIIPNSARQMIAKPVPGRFLPTSCVIPVSFLCHSCAASIISKRFFQAYYVQITFLRGASTRNRSQRVACPFVLLVFFVVKSARTKEEARGRTRPQTEILSGF